jgi:hypothetical protein
MNQARAGAVATLMRDGRVLVTGPRRYRRGNRYSGALQP